MFGRRKRDEDPFAALKDGAAFQAAPTTAADIGLGGESTARPPSPVAPASAVAAPAAPTATPSASVPVQTSPTRRAGPTAFSSHSRAYTPSSGGITRLVIFAIIIAAIAIPLISSVRHTVHSINIPSFNPGDGTSSNGATPSTPSAPSTTSYLHTSSLRTALHRIAGIAPHSGLSLLRLDRRSLSTTAVLPGGHAKLIYFGPSGTFVTSTSLPSDRPIPMSEINPSAINRIFAGMRRRFHVPASRINYLVLTSLPSRGVSWILFANTHGHPGYAASLSGTNLAPL
jgi:hypothetical protein